uniref:Uncharacterized protein n=1 Tax=Pelagomonas calceolata TaxID=35677 RepID=A0A7S3ZLQ0_9STRA|mmetsp:Transcript_25496/g.71697  ORF Transcript_25496/g.71697 Transcript_25496/m.71697 type:complete len:387 (+) Transcript_25496:70-1230(+)
MDSASSSRRRATKDEEEPDVDLPTTPAARVRPEKYSARAEVRLIAGFVVLLVGLLAVLLRHADARGRRAIGEFGHLDRAFVLSTRGSNGTSSAELERLKLQLRALRLTNDDIHVVYAPERVSTREAMLRRWSKGTGMRHLVHALVDWATESPKRHPVALVLEDDAVVLPGGVSVLNDALRYLESDTGLFGNWDILYAAHCGECLWWADALTDSSTARLGGGLAGDEVGLNEYAFNRSHDPGCNADAAAPRRRKRPSSRKLARTGARDVAVAVERRAVVALSGTTAALARAVDPRCSDALAVRYTPALAATLASVVDGDPSLGPFHEGQFDLTLARLAADRVLRAFVIWPPVVHRFHDGYGRPDDGYGMNSSQFITAWLELKTTRRR